MALTFSSGNFLSNAAAVATAVPLTVAGWARPTDGTEATLFMLDDGTNSNRMGLEKHTTGAVRAYSTAGGATSLATTTTTITQNVWGHYCGVWAAANDRRAFLNGAGKGTNTTSRIPANLSTTRIGTLVSNGFPFVGDLAEVAVWNVALSDEEVAVLADGISPMLVRPESLIAHWPLIGRASPEIDRVGGFAMTLSGTPVAAPHVRIYMPPRQRLRLVQPVVSPPSPVVPQTTTDAGGGGPEKSYRPVRVFLPGGRVAVAHNEQQFRQIITEALAQRPPEKPKRTARKPRKVEVVAPAVLPDEPIVDLADFDLEGLEMRTLLALFEAAVMRAEQLSAIEAMLLADDDAVAAIMIAAVA